MIITKRPITTQEFRNVSQELTTDVAIKIESWYVSADTGELVLTLSDFRVVNGSDLGIGTHNYTLSKQVHEYGLSQLPASPAFEQFKAKLYELLLDDYNNSPIYDINKLANNWKLRS